MVHCWKISEKLPLVSVREKERILHPWKKKLEKGANKKEELIDKKNMTAKQRSPEEELKDKFFLTCQGNRQWKKNMKELEYQWRMLDSWQTEQTERKERTVGGKLSNK